MAISDSFDLTNALNSQSYAYKCWYNYKYGNNTMQISANDMNKINQTWSGELANWKANALDDENKYEIEDDDFANAIKDGKEYAKDETGFDGKKGGMIVRGTVDAAAGVTGGLASTIGKEVTHKVASKVGSELIENTIENIGKKAAGKVASEAAAKTTEVIAEKTIEGATQEAAVQAGKKAGEKITEEAVTKATEKTTKASKNIGWIITAPLALATGTAYMAKKPNKEEKEACDVLRDETLPEAMGEVDGALQTMEEANEETQLAAETAQEQNDEATEALETDKTEFDFYNDSIKELSTRAASGEKLSEEEVNLYNSLKVEMATASENVDVTAEETQEIVEENHDIMLEQVDKYDDSATTVANVQGVTDYAENFDSATRTMCYVEGASQGLNALSGSKAAFDAGKFAASGGIFTAWAWGFSAMGAAGAVMSGIGSAQQFKWAGEVGQEIDSRKTTQDFNAEALDVYDESIEVFDGAVETVENLELPIPEDMEVPEENLVVTEEQSEENQNAQTGVFGATVETTGSNGATNTDNPQNDKKEKEK